MKCWARGRENCDDARFCQSCGRKTRRQESPNPPPAQAADGRRASSPHSRRARADYYPRTRYRGGAPPHVPNHLGWAIFVTVLCCLPAGVIAIAYAAQVNGMLSAGDYRGAERASKSASTWSWAGFGLAIGGWGVMFLFAS